MPEPEPAPVPDPGAEPVERLSAAEERFERWRRRLGRWLCLPIGFGVWAVGSDTPSQRLGGLMAGAGVLWVTEGMPVAITSLVAAAATVVFGLVTAKDAFAAFGHPLLFLFVGSFFLAEAMNRHGLGARFARALMRLAHGRLATLAALSGAAFVISLWISNTAATAVTLPVALSVARAGGDRRFGAALVLSIAYGASVGGIGTPIGTPPNLIGIAGLAKHGIEVGFVRWMAVCLPIGAAMLLILWGVLSLRFRIDQRPLSETAAEHGTRLPWSRGEVAVSIAFGLAVAMWITPGVLELAAPDTAATRWYKTHLPEEVVAILASAMLFLWPIGPAAPGTGSEPRRALEWSDAAHIDWGTILLFGGGILLGDLAGKTGLAARLGDTLIDATGASSLWGITALATAASILLSEATNNTATATLMVPLTISLATAAHVSIVPPVLGATLGASFGFMLPISTAPNAMAYGTGQVTVREMMSAGVVFDIVGFVVIVLGLRILCPLVGVI